MNEMTQNTGAGYASPFKSRYDNFIGGKFVAPVGGKYFDNITPITGGKICEVAMSGAADVELALKAEVPLREASEGLCAGDGGSAREAARAHEPL